MATSNKNYSFVKDQDLEKYTCSVCHSVFNNPHLTRCCGQHFCDSCLSRWFARLPTKSCPHCRTEGKKFNHFLNKSLKREIDCLKIHCTNKEEGCQWIGELGSLKDHLESLTAGCDYVQVVCDKCKLESIKRKHLKDHLKICSHRHYQCTYCGINGTYQHISSTHVQKECPEFPLECPNKCGVKDIKRKDMKDHHSQCPEELVECPYGCSTKSTHLKVNLRRKSLEKHLRECPLHPYQCQYCGLMDKYITITTDHYGKCINYPLECPNKCGRKDIKRKNMKDHRSQCPEEPVRCLFKEAGCKEKIVRHQLEQHMSANWQQHGKQHGQIIKELKVAAGKLKQEKRTNEGLNQKASEMEHEIYSLQEALAIMSSEADKEISRLRQIVQELETYKDRTTLSLARATSSMVGAEGEISDIEISRLQEQLRADTEYSITSISFLANRNLVLQQELEAANEALVNMTATFTLISFATFVSIGAYCLVRRYLW